MQETGRELDVVEPVAPNSLLDRLLPCAVPVALAIVAIVFFGLLTRGSFTTGNRVGLDAFYEGQARSLLDGRLNVTFPEIDGEAIVIHGKAYGYFGIVPAILRMPVMPFYPDGYPYLAPWSMMAAFALQTIAVVGLTRWLRRRMQSPSRWLPLYETAFVLSALGSASLQLASRPYKYEEAIMWGVAFGVAAFWWLLLLDEFGRLRYAILAGVAAIGAWGSRPPIGAGTSVALGLFLFITWRRSIVNALVVGAGAAAGLLTYSLVNFLRFHELFRTPYEYGLNFQNDPARLDLVNDGVINPRYMPTNLVQYLRPDTLHFATAFPWVEFRMPGYHPVWVIGSVRFDGILPTASVTSTMPLLVILSVVGFVVCLRDFRPGLALIAGGMVTAVMTIGFFGEVERYIADFVPLLTIGAVFGLLALIPRRGRDTAWIPVLCLVLALFSLWVNFALGFDAQQTGLI